MENKEKEKSSRLVLLIDSREKKPLEFREGIFDEIRTEALCVGDYGCQMYYGESEVDQLSIPIFYERKMISDLFSTLTQNYERFKREMQRAKEANLTLILLIEGSLEDIHAGYKHSQFSGDSMLKKLAMLRVRHDLEWHCFNSRRAMARYIEEIFSAIKRNWKVKEDSPCGSGY